MSIKLTEQQQQDLLSYIEGTLAPDAAARMEVFLANTDPRLAAEIADMMDQRIAVASLPKLKAPSDMTQRIMEQVERESLLDDSQHNLDMRPWWQSRWLMAASVAMVVSAFGYFVIHAAMKNSDTMDKWQVAANESAAKEKMAAMREDRMAAPMTPEPQVNQSPADMQAQQAALPEQNQNLNQNDAGAEARSLADAVQKQSVASDTQNKPRPTLMAARLAPGAGHEADSRKAEVPEPEVMVTLAARDPSDVERLRLLLLSMSGPTPAAKAAASSAPARPVPASEENAREDQSAGGEVLRARLTPESFRRITAQFSVDNVVTVEHKSGKSETTNADAANANRMEVSAGVPHSGEANYVFRFVASRATGATNAIAPAASQPANK